MKSVNQAAHDAYNWFCKNLLRILFPLTLPWVPLFYLAEPFLSILSENNFFYHNMELLLVLAGVAMSLMLSLLFYRVFPSFLRINGRVSLSFVFYKLFLNTIAVYISLTVVVVIVSLILDPPPWNSDNLQYIPLLFFAVVFYPPLLAPTFTIVAMWRSINKKLEHNS